MLQATVGRRITTWPIVTEASHKLGFAPRAQLEAEPCVASVCAVPHDVPKQALGRFLEHVEGYGDRSMGLADATLVVVAEVLGIREIVSVRSRPARCEAPGPGRRDPDPAPPARSTHEAFVHLVADHVEKAGDERQVEHHVLVDVTADGLLEQVVGFREHGPTVTSSLPA